MNLDILTRDRFPIVYSGCKDFVEYEIGLISIEEYYSRFPNCYRPGKILNLNKSIEVSDRVVMLRFNAVGEHILGTLTEWYEEEKNKVMLLPYKADLKIITIKDYIEASRYTPTSMKIDMDYAPKIYLDVIMEEVLRVKSLDLTLVAEAKNYGVYNNVLLKQIRSNITIPHSIGNDIIDLITASSKTYVQGDNFKSIKTYYDINDYTRARIEISSNIYGYVLTGRIIDLSQSTKSIDKLNYMDKAKEDIKKYLKNKHPGLKIIAGPTLSGKNTSIMSILSEYLEETKLKCISVEEPVEQINKNIIQINTETSEQYEKAVSSLIRHNPDIVYLTEINDATAREILKVANTGKTVFATIHANSPVDVVTRLQDLTGLSVRRIVMLLDTVIFQRLIRSQDGEQLYPIANYFNLDIAAKNRIAKLKDDREIINYLQLKTTSLLEYVNQLVEKDIITEEQRNEVL